MSGLPTYTQLVAITANGSSPRTDTVTVAAGDLVCFATADITSPGPTITTANHAGSTVTLEDAIARDEHSGDSGGSTTKFVGLWTVKVTAITGSGQLDITTTWAGTTRKGLIFTITPFSGDVIPARSTRLVSQGDGSANGSTFTPAGASAGATGDRAKAIPMTGVGLAAGRPGFGVIVSYTGSLTAASTHPDFDNDGSVETADSGGSGVGELKIDSGGFEVEVCMWSGLGDSADVHRPNTSTVKQVWPSNPSVQQAYLAAIYATAAPAPLNLTGTATDTTAATDSAARSWTPLRAVTESLTVSDTAIGHRLVVAAVTDGSATSDSAARAWAPSRPVTDGTTVTDAATVQGGGTHNVNDITAATDQVIQHVTHAPRQLSEITHATDTVVVQRHPLGAVTDNAVTSDSASRGLPPVEPLTIGGDWYAGDGDLLLIGSVGEAFDDVTTSDVASFAAASRARSVTDTTHATETSALSGGSLHGVVDIVHATDVASRGLVTARQLTESIALTDLALATLAKSYAFTDTVHATDVATFSLARNPSAQPFSATVTVRKDLRAKVSVR